MMRGEDAGELIRACVYRTARVTMERGIIVGVGRRERPVKWVADLLCSIKSRVFSTDDG